MIGFDLNHPPCLVKTSLMWNLHHWAETRHWMPAAPMGWMPLSDGKKSREAEREVSAKGAGYFPEKTGCRRSLGLCGVGDLSETLCPVIAA